MVSLAKMGVSMKIATVSWALLLAAALAFCVAPLRAQDETPLGDVARQNQGEKKHVIDNDSLGPSSDSDASSAVAQDAAATDAKTDDGTSKEPAAPAAGSKPSAKDRLAELQAKKQNWENTFDVLQKKIDTAKTDYERDLWNRDMDSARDGLAKTQAEMKDAQAEADREKAAGEEQEPQPAGDSQPPPSQ
jgi:hypothetical protein